MSSPKSSNIVDPGTDADQSASDAENAGIQKNKKSTKKQNKKINKKHPEFERTYDMMLGIRTTVGRTESKPYK